MSTLKKSDITAAGDFVINKVKRWTDTELRDISFKKGKPQVVAISNTSFRVGKYTVRRLNDMEWEVNTGDKLLGFTLKTSAIFYSLSIQLGKFELADSIQFNDSKLAERTMDFERYQKLIKLAQAQRDGWKSQLYFSRKKQAQSQYLIAKNQLHKTLRLAKYIKIWDPLT